MGAVEDHYEKLLAEHYTWMSGGHERQVAKNRTFFIEAGLIPEVEARALDLGCGSGYQSLALAELGYHVVAVDNSQFLLDELRNLADGQSITPLTANMQDVAAYSSYGPFDMAVCMGDTILHLQTIEEVKTLFSNVFSNLRDGGRFIISFRDLSHELTGTDRILPVRMDEDRLMSVFLEYHDQHVTINDLIFKREGDTWKMSKSAYRKLRMSISQATDYLTRSGFREVTTCTDQFGFTTIIASKTM